MLTIDVVQLQKIIKNATFEAIAEYNASKQHIENFILKKDAQKILNCGNTRLNNLVKNGFIRVSKDQKRVSKESLFEYLDKNNQ